MNEIASKGANSARGGRTRDLPSHPFSGGDLFISVKAVEWVFENSKSSGNARNVLLVLAAHYREGSSWPSFERIAKLANVSRPTLSKVISELEDLGELSVGRENGTGNVYTFPEFEAVNTGKVLGPNQLNSTPKPVNPSLPKELVREEIKAEEGSSSLPLCKEERRALPKPVKEPKVRKGFQKTFAKREYVPAPKPPETWNWFAKLWQRYTGVFPISRPEHWEAFDKIHAEFREKGGRLAIEDHLSRWLEQRSGKISAWSAVDFLNECEMLPEKGEGDIPAIANEE